MFFNDEELDEYINQIKKELDDFKKTRDIILNYFKSKSLSESIAIINNKYYLDIIDDLKQKQLYDYNSDYNHKIDSILFNYFTEQENAIEIQILDVNTYIEELDNLDFSEIYMIEENNQLYLLTSNMGQGYKTYNFQKVEIKSQKMQLLYNFSKEYKELKEKYTKRMKESFMLELLHSLKSYINNDFEKIAKTTNSSVYFERTKANSIKEIFRINFIDNKIQYYSVNHQTSVDDIKNITPDDEINFNDTDDIINYLYQ